MAAREILARARDRLLAGEELDSVGAVGVEVTEEGCLPAREGEEGNRSSHADVDPDHADLDVVAELCRTAEADSVKIETPLPKGLALTTSIASSRVSTLTIAMTGPKTSFSMIESVGLTLSRIVGPT